MAKYNNVKIDGYDSKKEYRRAKELKLLEKKGIITGLQKQVKHDCRTCRNGGRENNFICYCSVLKVGRAIGIRICSYYVAR